MDEKKPDHWHPSSRPPSSASHLSSAPIALSASTIAHPSFSQQLQHSQQHPQQQHPQQHPQQHQLQQHQLQQHQQHHHQQQQTNLLYTHADVHPSPRMVSAMQSRGLPEDPTVAGTALSAPHPFGAMPLLDAAENMLPPILPAKRPFPQEDAPAPSAAMPVPSDWAQAAPQNKMRVMRGLPRTAGSPSTTYALPRTQSRTRDTEQQPSLHAMRHAGMAGAGGAPADLMAPRMSGTAAGYALAKHSEPLYGSAAEAGPVDTTAFRAGDAKHALHDALSRPLVYSDALGALSGGGGPAFLPGALGGPHSYLPGAGTAPRGRRVSPCDDSFVIAAETGARAQCAVDNASGDGVFETYELGITIVQSSKLYANQRRSNRLLPGGSDSTTAACYMIGGTPDSVLSPLLARVSPCDPREERCKAVERVLKDKTRGAICALNGENPREARADNLAAVRICEVVADILVAFSSKRLFESRKQLFATVSRQEQTIKELREELDEQKRQTERWRKEVAEAGRGGDAGGGNGERGDGGAAGQAGSRSGEHGEEGRDVVAEEQKSG